jgi:hypothetical protein
MAEGVGFERTSSVYFLWNSNTFPVKLLPGYPVTAGPSSATWPIRFNIIFEVSSFMWAYRVVEDRLLCPSIPPITSRGIPQLIA